MFRQHDRRTPRDQRPAETASRWPETRRPPLVHRHRQRLGRRQGGGRLVRHGPPVSSRTGMRSGNGASTCSTGGARSWPAWNAPRCSPERKSSPCAGDRPTAIPNPAWSSTLATSTGFGSRSRRRTVTTIRPASSARQSDPREETYQNTVICDCCSWLTTRACGRMRCALRLGLDRAVADAAAWVLCPRRESARARGHNSEALREPSASSSSPGSGNPASICSNTSRPDRRLSGCHARVLRGRQDNGQARPGWACRVIADGPGA